VLLISNLPREIDIGPPAPEHPATGPKTPVATAATSGGKP
jgi:hypothetical protein